MSASIFENMYADEDYSPGPPDPPDGTEYDVQSLIALLDEAAAGSELAFSLSHALHTIEINCFRRQRRPLLADERLKILAAIERAYRAAWHSLPAEYPRSQIVAGMRGAVVMVERWHTKRELQSHDVLYDAKALTRCFRNDLHNACLRQEMQDRSKWRDTLGREVEPIFPTEPPMIAFVNAA